LWVIDNKLYNGVTATGNRLANVDRL